MKLKSGHEVVDLPKDEEEEQRQLFKGYSLGMIRLEPGNWFFSKPFADFADKIYDFKFKPTDTVIMTFPKCGTTWMQEIIWNMKHTSNLDNPLQGVAVNIKCPFLEFDFLLRSPYNPPPTPDSDMIQYFNKYCPGKDPNDGAVFQLAENSPDPRIMKTHLPFSLLTPDLLDTCKVVFVVRNPKDVCISFYHHSRLIKAHGYIGDFEKFVELFMSDKVVYGPYWEFLREGWDRRDHPNFHLVHFEDLKADPIEEITSLNDFLGTGLSEHLIERVAEETTFKKMKERDTFLGCPDKTPPFFEENKGSFFRSGTAGNWKSELTQEQRQTLDEWIKKNSENGKNFTLKYSI